MSNLWENSEPEVVRPTAGDYFIVSAKRSTWYVSTEMARFIEAVLDRWPRPQWVKFVDILGSRVRLQTRQIEYVVQCTVEQRALDREFSRALNREQNADRSRGEEE